MKSILTALSTLLIVPAVLATGAGKLPETSPREQAVMDYNSGESRLDKLEKLHAEIKAATDPAAAAKLQQKMTRGLENSAADFQRAVKNDPNLYQAYSELGFTLRKLGRYQQSLEAYDNALELSPNFSPAIEYRAEAYLGLNRIDDAKAAYMLLFSGDRQRADVLMVSMKSWLQDRQSNPAGVDPQLLASFSAWIAQRDTIQQQTGAPAAQTASFRSW